MIFLTLFLIAVSRETQPVVLVGDSVLDTPHQDEFVQQEDLTFQAFDFVNYALKQYGSPMQIPLPERKTVSKELQNTLGENYEVINNAVAGWRSEDVLNGYDGYKPLEKPMEGAVVIVSIGGNDFLGPIIKALWLLNKEAIAGVLRSSENRQKTMNYQKQIVEEIKKQNPKQIIVSLQYDPDFLKLCSHFKKENFGPFAEYMDSTKFYEGCTDIMTDMMPQIKEAITANRAEMINWYKENGVTVVDLRNPFYTENTKWDALHLNDKGIFMQVREYKEVIHAHENQVQDQAFELVD